MDQAIELPDLHRSLGCSHAASLALGPVSVSFYEAGLVVSMGSFVMTLTPLAPTILPPSLQPDS